MNKRRPEPHTLEDLVAEPDPEEIRARNQASTRQAIIFAAIAVVGTFLIALALMLTPLERVQWALAASIFPVIMLLACAVIMVRKLNRYERWMPWMGIFWIPMVPFTVGWLIYTLGIVAEHSAQ
ncbi:hypothetical protein KIP68_09705 [Corynebacterium aquatimens]